MTTETKADRFKRIAERRANETLRALRLLGNLADRKNYEYTDEQVTMLLNAIDREYRNLRSRFRVGTGSSNAPFRFKRGG